MRKNAAQRRYIVRASILSVAYVAALFTVTWLFRAYEPTGLPAFGLAILPAIPIVGVVFAIGRYLVEERDEYVRMIETRKALIATGFMLTVATAWGFLENFRLVPHVDAYFAAILWFAGLGVGSCVNALRR